MTRLAILSDIHGNAVALEAVRKAVTASRPDLILVAGDHALNGPEPAAAIDGLRDLQAAGALIVQGNTDVAVADFDYSAAFPWQTDGVPDAIRSATEWAHEALGEDRLEWSNRLKPAASLLVAHAPETSRDLSCRATAAGSLV